MTACTPWLPLRLVNPLNEAHGHWSRAAKTRRSHRDQTKLRATAALREAGLGWAPSSGHTFTYRQEVDRARRGGRDSGDGGPGGLARQAHNVPMNRFAYFMQPTASSWLRRFPGGKVVVP